MPGKSKGEGKYKHIIVEDKNKFDPRSFRVITLKEGIKATIGCPKGKWSPSKNKCKVGTRIQKKMILKEMTSDKTKVKTTKQSPCVLKNGRCVKRKTEISITKKALKVSTKSTVPAKMVSFKCKEADEFDVQAEIKRAKINIGDTGTDLVKGTRELQIPLSQVNEAKKIIKKNDCKVVKVRNDIPMEIRKR